MISVICSFKITKLDTEPPPVLVQVKGMAFLLNRMLNWAPRVGQTDRQWPVSLICRGASGSGSFVAWTRASFFGRSRSRRPWWSRWCKCQTWHTAMPTILGYPSRGGVTLPGGSVTMPSGSWNGAVVRATATANSTSGLGWVRRMWSCLTRN
jgi:hypothetical protein